MQLKKIFLLIGITCLAVFSAKSQTIINGRYYHNINSWYKWQGGGYINNLNIPKVVATTGLDSGAIRYDIADSSLYIWTGYQWRLVGSGSGGGAGVSTFNGRSGSVVPLVGDYAAFYRPISYVPSWVEVTGKPTTFAPSAHTHVIGDVTSLLDSLNSKLRNIFGYISAGSNVTITGLGTLASPYVINSTASGSGAITSVFGRTGVVVAQSADYSAFYRPISYVPAWSEITSKPTTIAGYGITDPIALTSGSYANPAWITSLAWSKLTGVPSTFTPATHSHIIADVTSLQAALDAKQATLVSGTNLKTVNGNSLLGSGNIAISGLTTEQEAQLAYAYLQSTKSIYFNNGAAGMPIIRKQNDSVFVARGIEYQESSEILADTLSSTDQKIAVSYSIKPNSIAHSKISTAPALTLFGRKEGTSGVMGPITVAEAIPMLGLNNAANLTLGSIPSGRFGAGTIPMTAIQIGGGSNGQILKLSGGVWALGTDNVTTDAAGITTGTFATARYGALTIPLSALVISGGTDGQVLKRVAGALVFANDESGGGGVSDGDKGDITIGSAGASYTIDNSAVTTAKIADGAVTSAKIEGVITGKEIVQRVQAATGSTVTPNVDAADQVYASFDGSITLNNPTGTPVDGQRLIVVLESGTTMGAVGLDFNSVGWVNPNSASGLTTFEFRYDVNTAKWDHTNQQIPRFIPGTTTSGSTITPVVNSLRDYSFYSVTALAANATVAVPSSTVGDGHSLLIRIKDNGTAKTLTWNAVYRAGDIPLPTTTTVNKTMYAQFVYNLTDNKYDFVGLTNGF